MRAVPTSQQLAEFPDATKRLSLRAYRTLDALLGRLTDRGIWGTNLLSRWLQRVFPLPDSNGPVVVSTSMHHRMLVDPHRDCGLERSLYYTGRYEPGTLQILEALLRPGDRFVDVGANIGWITVCSSRFVGPDGHVFAFEPVPSTIRILNQNIQLNGCSNVTVLDLALGAVSETREIHCARTLPRGSASLFLPNAPAETIQVKVDTVDHVLMDHEPIAAVKIDVEGWEGQVLKGGSRVFSSEHPPAVIVEYHGFKIGDESLLALQQIMRALNDYRFFVLQRGKERRSRLVEVDANTTARENDNLFCFLPDHIAAIGTASFRSS